MKFKKKNYTFNLNNLLHKCYGFYISTIDNE